MPFYVNPKIAGILWMFIPTNIHVYIYIYIYIYIYGTTGIDPSPCISSAHCRLKVDVGVG